MQRRGKRQVQITVANRKSGEGGSFAMCMPHVERFLHPEVAGFVRPDPTFPRTFVRKT